MNAVILGASGLVGHELLELLILDKRFEKIDLLSRRELDIRSVSVTNHVVEFDQLTKWPVHHDVDILFIAFGTTIKKAGSRERQIEVDVNIPTKIMKLAKENGVKRCVIVSALGVSLRSPFFYSRMKAQLDDNAKKMEFDQLVLVKPSVLEGPRLEKRTGEKVSILIGNAIGKTGLINQYRPVESINVAKAMIQSVIEHESGFLEIESRDINKLAKRYTEFEMP